MINNEGKITMKKLMSKTNESRKRRRESDEEEMESRIYWKKDRRSG
jgi:hypothetical protein